jgi:hypothetical protein
MRIGLMRLASAFMGLFLWGTGTLSYSEPSGVELLLQCEASAGTTQFRITLRNTGPTNTQIVLGINFGNGARYDADSFVLDVKRDDNSAIERYHPGHGQMNGQARPWFVQVPAMSAFSFLLPINGFHSLAGGESLKAGGYAVRLHWASTKPWFGRKTATVNDRDLFTGELTTEWLRVPDQCQAD